MKRNLGTVVFFMLFAVTLFAGPKEFFQNFGNKSVEAEPGKEYILTETDGPWLIHLKAFSGTAARQDADALVFELRKSLNLNAFQYEMSFVHDVNQDFRTLNNPRSKYQKKYLNSGREKQYAVVVGNFPSMEDKSFKKALETVKGYNPKCLQNKPGAVPLPLARSFGFANPLVTPANQSAVVDKFIESININRPYTLLRNPYRYTVRIATFSGRTIIRQDEIEAIENGRKQFSSRKVSELEMGERAATRLCKALRAQGIEAYEFYSRNDSIVTVGGFSSFGRTLPDGTIQYDPAVLQIVQRYQGQPITTGGQAGYKPVIIADVECDPSPKIIEVPRCPQR
ncbi:hypothetical protein FACS189419_05600 [Planctomycetales bacterium]|nr:hypothetical protein FACS189419_05600 [Planctomycetales bacterium]